MLNKTDLKILEFCSMRYRHLQPAEISRGVGLHITTVGDRLENLYKKHYLLREKSGKGFAYRFNFSADHARKFRLFSDMNFVYSLGIEKLVKFILENRANPEILCCVLYGSAIKSKGFNDIDMLIVYKQNPIKAPTDFDIFQMGVKSFRELFSIGEPRLQSAIVTGRIVIDNNFLFPYLENSLPIKASEDIISEIGKKYDVEIKSIQALKKPSAEELRKSILDLLQLKAVKGFASNRVAVPAKSELKKELSMIDPELNKTIEKVKSAKTSKGLWEIFYSEILET